MEEEVEVEEDVISSPEPDDTPSLSREDQYSEIIDDLADSLGVDPDLIHSVVGAESNYDTYAESSEGAQGLMQLMPANQKHFGVSNVFDPRENVRGGTSLLKEELDRYGGDEQLALAAFNAGSPAVKRATAMSLKRGGGASYDDIAPYLPPETQGYVPKVMAQYSSKKDGKVTDSAAAYKQQEEDWREPWGTTKEFALAVEELVTKGNFQNIPVKQQIQNLSRLYDSRKWGKEVDPLLQEITEKLWAGAAPDEKVNWAEKIGPAVMGDSPEEIAKSKDTNLLKIKKDLKDSGINPNLFGNQIDNYFDSLTAEELQRDAAKHRTIFGKIKAGAAEIGKGALEGYSTAIAAVPDLAGFEETGAAIRSAPTKVFGEHRDFDYEVDEEGNIRRDETGQPITKYEGTILRGLGQVGSLFGGGALLRAGGASLRALSVFMGGVNTLSAGDQAYAEAREEGANRQDALYASWISMGVAAPASLLDAQVFATKNYWLKGLTGSNRLRGIAQVGVQAAGAGAAGNVLTEAGVELGVNVATGKPFSQERLKIAAGAGAVAGGLFGGLEGRNYKPAPGARPVPNAPPQRPGSVPPPDTPLGGAIIAPSAPPAAATGPRLLEPPGERARLPLPDRYQSGPAVALGQRVSPEEEMSLTPRFEEFQKSTDTSMVIDYSNPEQIPEGLLQLFQYDMQQLSEKTALITKREDYTPPVVEGLENINARIKELSTELDDLPHPDTHADLVLERQKLKKQQAELAAGISQSDEIDRIIARRAKVEEDLEANSKQRALNKGEADRDKQASQDALDVTLTRELQVIEDKLTSSPLLAEQVKNREGLTKVTEDLKALQVPRYTNNLKARERELMGLLQKRSALALKGEGLVHAQAFKDAAIKIETDRGDMFIAPRQQKWYVSDTAGNVLTGGDWSLKGALDKARQSNTTAVQIDPVTAGTSPRGVPARYKIQRGFLNTLTAEAKGRLPHEIEELANRHLTAQEGGTREIDITKIPGKAPKPEKAAKGKKKKGPPTPDDEITNDTQPFLTDAEVRADLAGKIPPVGGIRTAAGENGADKAENLKADPYYSTTRLPPKQPNKTPVGFVDPQMKQATGPTPASKSTQAAEAVLSLLTDSPVTLTAGAAMRQGVAGYYQFKGKYVRYGRIHDVSTMVHEVMHVVADYTIDALDRQSAGFTDFAAMPPKIRADLIDTAVTFYGGALPDANIATHEGLAVFLQNMAVGRPIKPEVLKWFNTEYKQAFGKEHAAIMKMVEASQEYFTQSPEEFARQFRTAKNPNILQRLAGAINRRNFFTQITSSSRIFAEIDRALGSDLKDQFDAQRNTAESIAYRVLNKEMVDLKGNVIDKRSLKTILAPIEKAGLMEELQDYMVAMRSSSYYAKGLESGMSVADFVGTARAIATKHPEIVYVAHEYWDAQHRMMGAWAESSSVASLRHEQQTKANLAATGTEHGYYSPFGREGKGDIKFGTQTTGSTRRIQPPLELLGGLYRNIISATKKQASLEQVLLVGSRNDAHNPLIGGLVREITADVYGRATMKELDSYVENKTKELLGPEGTRDNVMQELDATRKDAEDLARYTVGVYDPPSFIKAPDGYDIVVLPTDQGTRFFEVSQDVTKAYDDSVSELMRNPVVSKLTLGPKKILQAAATTFQPAFQLNNFARDTATLYRRSGTWNPAAVLKDVIIGLQQASFSNVGIKSFTKWADMAERSGARNSSRFNQELYDAKLKSSGYKAFDMIGTSFRHLTDILGTLEEAPRLAAWMRKARELGVNPDSVLTDKQSVELINAYKRGTTDFSEQGRFTREVNRVVPFFTARIAETTQTLRDFKRYPGKSAAELIGWLALGYAYAHSHKDDTWYTNLDPIERNKNYLVPIEKDGDKRLAKIALTSMSSWGFGFGQAVASHEIESKQTAPELSEWIGGFVKETIPFPISGFGIQNFAEGSTELLGPIGKEVAQQLTNRDFYFNKVILPRGVEMLSREDQVTPYTTEFSKSIGGLLNWSPARMDHAIRSMVPAAMTGLQFAEKNMLDKKLRNPSEGKGLGNFLVNTMLRYELANATFDRSEKKFYEVLDKFAANKDAEKPEEAMARKKLSRIQDSLSDLRILMVHADLTQPERDAILEKKKALLSEGNLIAEGQLQTAITPIPKAQAKATRKAVSSAKKEKRSAGRGPGTIFEPGQ